MNKTITRILSIILGVIFLISGGVKAIDPFGGALKIEEYIAAFNLTWLQGCDTILSVLLVSGEMLIGLFLIFKVFQRITAIGALLFMMLFTVITAYLAFDPYVTINECGCFGEAIKLTNHQTFFKNIVILCIAILYIALIFRIKRSCKNEIILALYLAIFSISIPMYSISHLPPFDFLHFNVGTNIENSSSFKVFDLEYQNVTDSILNVSYDTPVLAITHTEKLDNKEICKIDKLIKKYSCQYSTIVLSGTTDSNYEYARKFYADNVLIKELVRARVGVIAITRGVITNKYNLLTLNVDKLDVTATNRYIFVATIIIGLLIAFLITKLN